MGGKVYGGFTVDVLRSRMSPTELKAHDAEWGPLEFGLPGKVFVVPTVAVDSQKSLRLEETAEWPEHPLSESMAVSLESLIKERPELLTHFDENGRSLLHHEVLKGSAAMVAELLKRGAKPLARDKTGVSAKDLAEKMGWSQIVRLFDEELRTLSPGHKIFAFIVTDIGKIKIELEADRAPKTVAHFLECAKTGFYNNTLCNRILDFSVFFAQDAKLKNMVYEQTVESESSNGLKNLRYTLAMVPLAGNPHSAAGAFFINLDCNDMLDYQGEDSVGYTVFGRVTEGFDVVENIRTANTLTRCSGHEVPMKAVVVEKIHVQETQLRRAKT
jgi:peptidyl-prolyl cis-trans isomerase B (cyclophilin B)